MGFLKKPMNHQRAKWEAAKSASFGEGARGVLLLVKDGMSDATHETLWSKEFTTMRLR